MPDTTNKPGGYVTVPRVAGALGVTRGLVLRMLHDGELVGIKTGTSTNCKWLVSRSSVLLKFPEAGI
jgi:excisionase family DNA binding protein